VIEYFKTRGYNETGAIRAHEYYSTADWHDSKGNKVVNWKQKMVSVWMRDEYKIKIPVKPIEHERW